MIETPQIVQTEAQQTAVIHLKVPPSEMRNVMGPGIQELLAAVQAQGAGPAGPWFTRHFRITPELFDFEISVPVTKPITPVGRVKPSVLPPARVARTVYRGPYEGLPNAWPELDEWIAANGHAAREDLWEIYLKGPESGADPSAWETQLNRPLRMA